MALFPSARIPWWIRIFRPRLGESFFSWLRCGSMVPRLVRTGYPISVLGPGKRIGTTDGSLIFEVFFGMNDECSHLISSIFGYSVTWNFILVFFFQRGLSQLPETSQFLPWLFSKEVAFKVLNFLQMPYLHVSISFTVKQLVQAFESRKSRESRLFQKTRLWGYPM